jgi:predicted PurR-regulated permease PerM
MAPLALALILLPFAGRLRRTGRRMGRILSILMLAVLGIAAVAGISGCGSTSGFFAQQQQSYTVTITGTAGSLSHSTTVTLIVE